MQEEIARQIERRALAGRRNRTGASLLDHTGRVAAAASQPACATAWLRDIVEHGSVTALRLVTRDPLGSYELYVLRIAAAQERQLKAEVNA